MDHAQQDKPSGEPREERAYGGGDSGANPTTPPVTLGYASPFGIPEGSNGESLTQGSSGTHADVDIPPFGRRFPAEG